MLPIGIFVILLYTQHTHTLYSVYLSRKLRYKRMCIITQRSNISIIFSEITVNNKL